MKIEVNTQNCIEIDFKHSYSDRPVLYITCEKEILDQKIKINDQRFCLNIEEQNAQYYKYKVNFNNLEIIILFFLYFHYLATLRYWLVELVNIDAIFRSQRLKHLLFIILLLI